MSMWSSACKLISQKPARDEHGVITATEASREVPCNVFSVSAASYYAAAAAGMHPEAVVQIRRCAYNGELAVELDGRRFSVDRCDTSSPDYVRLTLSEAVGDRG